MSDGLRDFAECLLFSGFLVYAPAGWKVNEGNRVFLSPFAQQTCLVRCEATAAEPEHRCTVKCERPDRCERFVIQHGLVNGFYGQRKGA